jgi:hypothetical protein
MSSPLICFDDNPNGQDGGVQNRQDGSVRKDRSTPNKKAFDPQIRIEDFIVFPFETSLYRTSGFIKDASCIVHTFLWFWPKQRQTCINKTSRLNKDLVKVLIHVHETGPNVIRLFNGNDKNPPLIGATVSANINENSHQVIHFIVVNCELDHDFRRKHAVLSSAVDADAFFLIAVSDWSRRETRSPFSELLYSLVEPVQPNDALNQFHGFLGGQL